jgi:predicted dehydrogenase
VNSSAQASSGADGAVAVGVIGCGRMGRFHARVYSTLPGVRLVGIYDANFDVAESAAAEIGCKAVRELSDLLAQVQAVTIATPTATHLSVAEVCFAAGVSCLIEKPLAKNIEDADRIVAGARASGLTVQVGHIERFNPAIRAMDRLDIRPGFIEVIRISPMTFRSIDVGVVLDMMIHDIDIVLRLAGSPIASIAAVGVSVIGDVEDICNARITFANGCVANMTASRLALKTERKLRVFSRDAYVSLDYQKRYGIVARRSGNLQAIRDAVGRIRSGEIEDLTQLDFADLVQIEELAIDDTEPLRAELESFVGSVRSGAPPAVPVEDGAAAVRAAMQIVDAIAPQLRDLG